MKTALLALALVVLVPFAVSADDTLVRFKGGIGVDPVSGINTSTTPVSPVSNVVCGVAPGGAPWRIGKLDAKVQTDGHITVDGRGLLLAGANAIATNAGQSVMAELFCNTTATSCGTAHISGLVPLEADGDFHIDDTLSSFPLPSTCANPVLLITNGAPRWFAAGIPQGDDR
jgi:hypothetical protein